MKKALSYQQVAHVTHKQKWEQAHPKRHTFGCVATLGLARKPQCRGRRTVVFARPLHGHDIPLGDLPLEPAEASAAGIQHNSSPAAAGDAATANMRAAAASGKAAAQQQRSQQVQQAQPAVAGSGSSSSTAVDVDDSSDESEAAAAGDMLKALGFAEQWTAAAMAADCDPAALASAEPDINSRPGCGRVFLVSGEYSLPGSAKTCMEHLYAYLLLDGYTHLAMQGASNARLVDDIPRVLHTVEFKELWGSLSCKPQRLCVFSVATGRMYYYPLVAFFLLRRLFPALDVATLDAFAGFLMEAADISAATGQSVDLGAACSAPDQAAASSGDGGPATAAVLPAAAAAAADSRSQPAGSKLMLVAADAGASSSGKGNTQLNNTSSSSAAKQEKSVSSSSTTPAQEESEDDKPEYLPVTLGNVLLLGMDPMKTCFPEEQQLQERVVDQTVLKAPRTGYRSASCRRALKQWLPKEPDMPTDVNPLPSSDGLFAYPSEAKAVATDSYSYAINDEDGLPLFPGDSILQMSESAAEGMASCFEANQSLAALIAAEKLYKGSKAGSIKALRDKFDKVTAEED